MRKKGFTLIELLAVIVILAIIALIATPIILNIINDSKKEAILRSSSNYIDAVNLAIARENLNSEFNPDVCEIQSNGDLLCNAKKLNIEVDGEKPSEGWILISDGKVEQYSIKMSDSVVSQDETGKVTMDSEIKEQPGSEDETNHLAKENVSAVENPTINGAAVGITPELDTNGNIKPGSTFNIKVNEQDTDGSIFYVLSNEGDYVNLIAQQNITIDGIFTSEPQDNDEWYVTSSNSNDNRYGPQKAYTYLSTATSNWTNIPIIESFTYLDEGNQSNSNYGYQGITTTLDSESGNYITTITPFSSDYGEPVTYENMRARMPKYSEVTASEVGCTSSSGSCPLWMVNYLYSNSTSEKYYTSTMGKVNSTGSNYGYWILSSSSGNSNSARYVNYYGHVISNSSTSNTNRGLRPVITILKSDLLRVM